MSAPSPPPGSTAEQEKEEKEWKSSKGTSRDCSKERKAPPSTVALEGDRKSCAERLAVADRHENHPEGESDSSKPEKVLPNKLMSKELSATTKLDSNPKSGKRGVIYLSRLPPNIDITSVRVLLSRMGKITNMWLRPETREQQKQRFSLGGSRRRTTFRDGWVEYLSRKDARDTVQLLNGRPMTGTKRKGRWANDLWCMKFLPGFEWRHLTSEIFGGRERILRVREEMAAARQQRNWVEERSRLAERFRKKGELDGDVEPVRRFLQKRPVPDTVFDDDYDEKRARQAASRVDEELESGKQAPALSEELIKLLVKTKKTAKPSSLQ